MVHQELIDLADETLESISHINRIDLRMYHIKIFCSFFDYPEYWVFMEVRYRMNVREEREFMQNHGRNT